ncbi:hypothetical protein [Streptomyces sp. NPDC102437]|uniref:hypothetical protein n=1 Tax=Streptomyces sp. NPDC102437 TaxID=3366175 RepID=UPI00382C1732
MICVDCDRTITGPYVIVSFGDSMSGAREDSHAHPAKSPECQPNGHRGKQLRRAIDGLQEIQPFYY